MYKNLTDEQLIQLIAKNKDKKAFNEIYERYNKPIYNYLNKLVFDKDMLEEIFQEVFTKIYLKASTFKVKYNFKSWIYKISMNQYIDYYKKLKRKEKFFKDSEKIKRTKYDVPDIVDDIIEQESIEILKQLIESLPEKFKQAIILKKIEEFTYDQAAEIMGVSSRSVKTYVTKGMQILKNKFGNIYEEMLNNKD
ncbi:MAG: RNA polymerase sigma factor [Spirochaetota bacterium]